MANIISPVGFFALLFCGLFLVSGAFCKTSNSLIRKGNKAYQKGDYNFALENYRQVLKKSPSDTKALYNAGNAMYKAERFDEAEDYYKKSSEDKKYSARALFNLANSHAKSGDLDDAKNIYKNIIIQNPDDKKARYNLQVVSKHKKQDQNKQDNQKDKKPEHDKDNQKKQPSMSGQDAMRLLEIAKEKEQKTMQAASDRQKSKYQKAKTAREPKDW